jgi:hypothetical protein
MTSYKLTLKGSEEQGTNDAEIIIRAKNKLEAFVKSLYFFEMEIENKELSAYELLRGKYQVKLSDIKRLKPCTNSLT